MKKLFYLVMITALFASCETAENEQRIADLEKENQQLVKETAEKDSVLQAFDETFSMITRNLAMIREGEESIRLESGDVKMTVDQRAAIESEIQDINALLQSNREQVQNLNSTIAKYQGDAKRYQNLIAGLEDQITSKDREIEDLKQNLVAANFTIDILNKMNEELAEEIRTSQGKIERMTEQSNEVYYVIGTFSELKEKGIAERAGILAGKKMRQDFNREDFIEIDRREVMEISISSSDADILSPHPPESYEFHGEEEDDYRLVITDIEEFWSTTSYLIIQIK